MQVPARRERTGVGAAGAGAVAARRGRRQAQQLQSQAGFAAAGFAAGQQSLFLLLDARDGRPCIRVPCAARASS